MSITVTDRIEKKAVLKAPRSRVWRAITVPAEFGAWFGVDLSSVRAFEPGQPVSAPITIPGYEHLKFEVEVERVVPEELLSFRWHPHPIPPERDYSSEPTTLIEFRLRDAGGDTELTIVESGFDRIPLDRRAEAFRGNDEGWTSQLVNLGNYLKRK